jgi:ubiquinone biosynthesis protein COQ4
MKKLSTVEKLLYSVGGSVMAMIDPERADMVAAVGDVTGEWALRRMRDSMLRTSSGSELLRLKPVITKQAIGWDRLGTLDENTFGRHYFEWMSSRHYDPDERPAVRFVEDEELRWVMLRYRQVHDFWHVLANVPTDVGGELALKCFEFVQTGLPVCAMSALVGPARLSSAERAQFLSSAVPWALESASRATSLIGVHYEHHFDDNIDELRRHLNLNPYVK